MTSSTLATFVDLNDTLVIEGLWLNYGAIVSTACWLREAGGYDISADDLRTRIAASVNLTAVKKEIADWVNEQVEGTVVNAALGRLKNIDHTRLAAAIKWLEMRKDAGNVGDAIVINFGPSFDTSGAWLECVKQSGVIKEDKDSISVPTKTHATSVDNDKMFNVSVRERTMSELIETKRRRLRR